MDVYMFFIHYIQIGQDKEIKHTFVGERKRSLTLPTCEWMRVLHMWPCTILAHTVLTMNSTSSTLNNCNTNALPDPKPLLTLS